MSATKQGETLDHQFCVLCRLSPCECKDDVSFASVSQDELNTTFMDTLLQPSRLLQYGNVTTESSMTTTNPQAIRSIDDVTDDELVNAIAVHGLLGIDLDDTHEGNAIERACRDLGMVSKHAIQAFDSEVDLELSERLHAMCDEDESVARFHIPVSNYLMLTPLEWGRRLAGKSAEEITVVLRGGGFRS